MEITSHHISTLWVRNWSGMTHLFFMVMEEVSTQDTLYGLGCVINFKPRWGNNVRGHHINTTSAIYNNLASFFFTLGVSLEDSTTSPIISVSLLCQCTPYHIHSGDTKDVLEIINCGRYGSNTCEVARIIFPFCFNILDFFEIWVIYKLLNIFDLFIIFLNDKGSRGTFSCNMSNPIPFETLEART